jgi:hypothetical protein
MFLTFSGLNTRLDLVDNPRLVLIALSVLTRLRARLRSPRASRRLARNSLGIRVGRVAYGHVAAGSKLMILASGASGMRGRR